MDTPTDLNPEVVASPLEQTHRFPVRTYSPRIMCMGALLFGGFAVYSVWLFAKDGNVGAAVFSLLVWGGAPVLILLLLRANRQSYELTPDALSLLDKGKAVKRIPWKHVENLDLALTPTPAGWVLSVLGPNKNKIEIDGNTPGFDSILQLVRSHAAANGKEEMVQRLTDGLSGTKQKPRNNTNQTE